LANSASTDGSAVPALSINACNINRPDTPVISLATEDDLIPASSQQLFQPLDLSGPFPGDHRPGPGQVPQLTDRFRRHEVGPHQTVSPQIGQPSGVGHIGLAPGDIPHAVRVTSIT